MNTICHSKNRPQWKIHTAKPNATERGNNEKWNEIEKQSTNRKHNNPIWNEGNKQDEEEQYR